MNTGMPAELRARARSRRPFPPEDYQELVAASLEERLAERLAELDRAAGGLDLPAPPPPPQGRLPRKRRALPPAQGAKGGVVTAVRGAWIAKHDPTRAVRERRKGRNRSVYHSDVYADVDWANPRRRARRAVDPLLVAAGRRRRHCCDGRRRPRLPTPLQLVQGRLRMAAAAHDCSACGSSTRRQPGHTRTPMGASSGVAKPPRSRFAGSTSQSQSKPPPTWTRHSMVSRPSTTARGRGSSSSQPTRRLPWSEPADYPLAS